MLYAPKLSTRSAKKEERKENMYLTTTGLLMEGDNTPNLL